MKGAFRAKYTSILQRIETSVNPTASLEENETLLKRFVYCFAILSLVLSKPLLIFVSTVLLVK